jgi:glucose-6-phosphate dehydrogenase assembly protein OpcA
VSALTGGRVEVGEWHGEDVEVDEVADRLMRMNLEHARHEHGHAATRTLNLLVVHGRDVAADALAEQLERARTRHPSRTLVLREHDAARIDARLTIECDVCGAPGNVGTCHDAVTLVADATRLAHADSLVHALLVAGLPTLLWLPGAHESPAERPLAAQADAVVLDSAAGPDLCAAVERAARLGAATHVRDLAWLRLTRWRQRVAARFEAREARALLAAVTRLEVRCGGGDAATPLLLAAWIAARAGWRIAGLERDEDGWRGAAQRDADTHVEIAVGPCGAGAPTGVHAVALATARETLELVEPIREPDAARTFAAALRAVDEPAAGYAPALAALREGLAAR